MPAVIAPKHFQAEQSLVASFTPKLARSFEAALCLPASGLNRAAANGFVGPPSRPIIHAPLMLMEIGHFFGDSLRRRSIGHLCQRLFQPPDDFDGGLVL